MCSSRPESSARSREVIRRAGAAAGIGVRRVPNGAVSTGGKYVYNDDQETPNTQYAALNYGDSEITFEVRGYEAVGEGIMRWAPVHQKIVAMWDYEVEND